MSISFLKRQAEHIQFFDWPDLALALKQARLMRTSTQVLFRPVPCPGMPSITIQPPPSPTKKRQTDKDPA
jgi:hypothetical protein